MKTKPDIIDAEFGVTTETYAGVTLSQFIFRMICVSPILASMLGGARGVKKPRMGCSLPWWGKTKCYSIGWSSQSDRWWRVFSPSFGRLFRDRTMSCHSIFQSRHEPERRCFVSCCSGGALLGFVD